MNRDLRSLPCFTGMLVEVAAFFYSLVRPTLKFFAHPTVFLLLGLTGCASTGAPALQGTTWAGQDGSRLTAQLRHASSQLPQGWLIKVQSANATGSFAYRKRSGTYDYSQRGYFATESRWRGEQTYIGHLEAGGIFCVLNPEMKADVSGNTVTTYKAYDYCVQLQTP